MKKEELIQAIDSIQPDIHMKTRLNAKITNQRSAHKKTKKITRGIAVLCLAVAVISGSVLFSKTPQPQDGKFNETSVQSLTPGIMKAFIVVASAANTENGETVTVNKTLEIDDKYPYAVHLKVTDIQGLSDKEKTEILKKLNDELDIYCNSSGFSKGRSCTCGSDSFFLTQCSINEFRLDLEESENIKSVNVKNTSEYGQMVYCTNKPAFKAPEHGNDITVSGEDFDCMLSGFYWDHTDEMEKALEENINLPFSAFDDVITFTVEYNDGSKAIGVVELSFDSTGSATAMCKSYEYINTEVTG